MLINSISDDYELSIAMMKKAGRMIIPKPKKGLLVASRCVTNGCNSNCSL